MAHTAATASLLTSGIPQSPEASMSRIPLLPATSMVAAALVLAACNKPAEAPVEPAATSSGQASDSQPAHSFDASITTDDFAAHVQTLASDAFAGRAPGSV